MSASEQPARAPPEGEQAQAGDQQGAGQHEQRRQARRIVAEREQAAVAGDVAATRGAQLIRVPARRRRPRRSGSPSSGPRLADDSRFDSEDLRGAAGAACSLDGCTDGSSRARCRRRRQTSTARAATRRPAIPSVVNPMASGRVTLSRADPKKPRTRRQPPAAQPRRVRRCQREVARAWRRRRGRERGLERHEVGEEVRAGGACGQLLARRGPTALGQIRGARGERRDDREVVRGVRGCGRGLKRLGHVIRQTASFCARFPVRCVWVAIIAPRSTRGATRRSEEHGAARGEQRRRQARRAGRHRSVRPGAARPAIVAMGPPATSTSGVTDAAWPPVAPPNVSGWDRRQEQPGRGRGR